MEISRLTNAEFHNIYARVPRAVLDLLLIMPDGGVVMNRRSIDPEKGKWCVPGGTIYRGEKFRKAAERIAMDEVGVAIGSGRVFGASEYFGDNTVQRHDIVTIYRAEYASGDLRPDKDASEVGVFWEVPENEVVAHCLLYNALLRV